MKISAARLILQFFTLLVLTVSIFGQDQVFDVSVTTGIKPFATITSKNTASAFSSDQVIRFESSIAGISGLGLRVNDLKAFAANGEVINTKVIAPGEYQPQANYSSLSYKIDLKDLQNRAARAHTSWLDTENGILMLTDMLPIQKDKSSIKIKLILPAGWSSYANAGTHNNGEMTFDDVDQAIIPVGTTWRTINVDGCNGRLVLSGKWLFTDEEAAKFTGEICKQYTDLFASAPAKPFQVVIGKFAGNVSHGAWQAETRGRNVTIISSDMPFQTGSVQRLHEQLRHEIFHLWIPNGISLTGRYDWFYEGFALYQSLRSGLATNRISFDDFLDTLSRANNIDAALKNRVSLLEASAGRWTGDNTMLYARGMLVAFAFDLALLGNSNGKRSVNELISEFYKRNRDLKTKTDANDALRSFLTAKPDLSSVYDRYVTGTELLDLGFVNSISGIENGQNGQRRFTVSKKLSGRQKAILDALGYNNWRKSPRIKR